MHGSTLTLEARGLGEALLWGDATMKKVMLLLTFVVAAGVAAVVLGVRNWPSEGLDAETVLAQAQAQEDGVLAQLTEGKALHQVDVVYRRYGPAAGLIREMTTEWYLPERYAHELWLEIGSAGVVTQARGWVRDEHGVLLQDISTVGAEVVTKDVASGAETRLPLSLSVEDIKANLQGARRSLDEAVLRGDAAITERSPRLVLEQQLPPPTPAPTAAPGSLSRGYSIPYLEDISTSGWISRTEVDPNTFAVSRSSIVVVDTAGQEHVVEEWQTMVFEIVDGGQVPQGAE